MATINNENVFVNIKELPQVGGIQGGDLLVVETEDGTNIIDFDDIIIDTYQTTFFNVLTANDLALSTEIDTISDDLNALEVTVDALGGTAFNALSAQINTNTKSITAINVQISSLSGEIDTINSDIITLNAAALSGGIKAYGYIELASTSATNPVTFSETSPSYNVLKYEYDRHKTSIPITGAISPYLRIWKIFFAPGVRIGYVDIQLANVSYSQSRRFDISPPALSTIGPGSTTSYYVSVSTQGPGSADPAFRIRFSAF